MTSPGTDSALLKCGVYVVFLMSGVSGLLFETLWTYQATLALGSSYWAVTAVLAAFMAGLALGNLLSLRRSAWTLAGYAVLESVIVVSGPAALVLLPVVGRMAAPVFGAVENHPGLLLAARFAFSFLVLVVPCTAMGMTLPALAQALGGEQGSFRPILGRLYGLNTLGAIGGVLAAELVLLGRVGILGTAAFAAALNGLAALGAWALARRHPATGGSGSTAWDRKIPAGLIPAFAGIFLTGFALLALEVVWTRFMSLFVPNNSLSFALMLAVVLAGIALGGMAGGAAWVRKPFGFLLLLAAGLAVIGSYAGLPWYQPATESLIRNPSAILRMGFLLQFPVSFLSGTFFTIAGTAVRDRIESSQASAGLLSLFNTAGAAVGAVIAGFFMVPRLGLEKCFFVLAIVYGLVAVLWFSATGGNRRWGIIGGAAWLAGLILFPFGQFQQRHLPEMVRLWTSPNTRIEAVREGLFETNLVLRTDRYGELHSRRLIANSFSMSSNNVPSDRYMRAFVYWPVALHPAPRRALLICFGVGGTARALTRTRELEHIDVVDLSPDILDLSSVIFPDPKIHPLHDPRVTVHLEDGRFFLQTRRDSWDVITGEPPPPDHPGVAGLYSREYFQLMKDRLTEGGIATYWLPVHTLGEVASRSVLKAWSEVFETCFLWRGARKDLILVGYRGRPLRVDEERFTAQWRDPRTLSDLVEVGYDLPELLGTGFVGDGPYIRSLCSDAEPTLDAYPKRVVAKGTSEEMFESWFNANASADRFMRSASIAEIWPPALRERTVPYFKWEVSLTSLGSYPWRSRFPPFSEFHRLCTTTSLKSLVLWALDSDRDAVRVAEGARPAYQNLPIVQYHRAAHALSDRDYARAADLLLKIVHTPEVRKMDLALCLYTLCMAGRKAEAELQLATVSSEHVKLLPPEYWGWMSNTFGLARPPERR